MLYVKHISVDSKLALNVGGLVLLNAGGNILLNPDSTFSDHAKVDYTGDSTETDYPITFNYRYSKELIVQVYNTTTNLWEIKTEGTDYDIIDGKTVRFLTGKIPGAKADVMTHNVEIWRQTRREVLPSHLGTLHHSSGEQDHPTKAFGTVGYMAQELEDQLVSQPEMWSINRWVNNITSANPRMDTLSMTLIPPGVDKPYTFDKVSVSIQHAEVGVLPTDWSMKLYVIYTLGGAGVLRAEFPTDFTGLTFLVKKSFVGRWRDPTTGHETVVDVDPGQLWYVEYTGSTMDKLLGRCTFARRWRIPHN